MLHLLLEALAEGVVDERVVDGGGLGKQAGQHGQARRNGRTVVKNGPEVDNPIGCPAADESSTDQHSNLQ